MTYRVPRPNAAKESRLSARRIQMKALYEEGYTVRQIADEMRCSYQNVHAILRRLGVRMRPPGFAQGTGNR